MKNIALNYRSIISLLIVFIIMLKQQQDVGEATGRAAHYVHNADVLLIAAGAGMGVDAGLPDYYGGIQLAHPRLAAIGLSVYDLSNHGLFEHNPALAWGHWITRQREYMNTLPHVGYDILYAWSKCSKRNVRVITTNLDRHFVRSGFPSNNVFEMHGSMYDAQCMHGCGANPWPLDIANLPSVDLNTMLLLGPPPLCKHCGGPARVCTELAVDGHWDASHVEESRMHHKTFFRELSAEQLLTVLEIGCGTVMAKVRTEAARIVGEHRMHGGRAAHIRINLHQAHIDEHENNISLPLGALEALRIMD
jgi:NAD-dependent SIR2 family protein deacetylase